MLGIPNYSTIDTDGLKQDWTQYKRIWINPPFYLKFQFLEKAVSTYKRAGNDIYFLAPVSILTAKKFHELIEGIGIKLYIPKGRIGFRRIHQEKEEIPAFGCVIFKLQKENEIKMFHIIIPGGHYIVDEERAPKVQKLFSAYATGNYTLKDLYFMARDMNLRSLYKKEQAKPLSIPVIQHMLKNPFYYGVMKVKKKYYPHKYPPLITKDLWDMVQEVLKGRARAPSHLSYGEKEYMFKGLVKCGTCGCLMTCETRTKKNGKKYNYLKCNHLKNNCHQKPINENTLIQQLKDEVFSDIRISDNMLNNIKLAIRERMKNEITVNASIKRGLTKDIDEIKAKEDRLLSALLDGDIDRETFKLEKAEYEAQIKELQESRTKYDTDNKELTDLLEKVAEVAANAKKIFDSPIISKKNEQF